MKGSEGTMTFSIFASVDYWAVFIAAVAGFALGAVWYRIFAAPWMAATGLTEDMLKGDDGSRSPLPFILAFVANLVMAFVLYGVAWHGAGGRFTVKGGIIAGVLCWLGFVITTMTVNNAFSRHKPVLLAIDGGFWLVVLVAMGAIIGGLGR
jgi:hypothetical protein